MSSSIRQAFATPNARAVRAIVLWQRASACLWRTLGRCLFAAAFGLLSLGSGSASAQSPDLSLSGLTLGGIAANANGSWTIAVSFTVTNVGTGSAQPNWFDVGYLSSDSVLDNADQSNNYLNWRTVALAAGASYNVNASFTTSTSTAPGSYTFFVKTDGRNSYTGGTPTNNGVVAEASETNNTASLAVTLSRPDLSVSGLTSGSVVANTNGSFTIPVSFTVTNVGTMAAQPNWFDVGYLSGDGVLDDADQSNTYLMWRTVALGAGASYNVNASFTTSTSTAPGSYTFFVKTDGRNSYTGGTPTNNGVLSEASETNNTASVAVTLSKPDLSVSGLTVGSVVTNANGSFTIPVSYTVTNVSPVAAPAAGWYEKAYLSNDAVLDDADQTNGSLMTRTTALAAGASYTVNASFTTSTGTAPGSYYIIVKTDGMGAGIGGTNTSSGNLLESSETNNTASAAVTLNRSDLSVSGLTVGSVVTNANGSFTIPVSYTVTNVGSVAAPAITWYEKAYLSSNAVLDDADQTNGSLVTRTTGLAAGASYTVNASFTTSTGTAPGSYYIIVKTDGMGAGIGGTNTSSGQLIEASETNNTASAAVTLNRSDLSVSGLTVGAIVSNANGSFTIPVSYTVTNDGPVAAQAVLWFEKAYLSSNAVLDDADQTNGSLSSRSTGLASGASYAVSGSFTTSTSTTPGGYTLFVKTDGHGAGIGGTNTNSGNLVEGNETNNTASATVVLIAPGTPTTTSLSASANPITAGQSTTLTATVTGTYATGTVTFKDGTVTLGTTPLSASVATLTPTFSSAGSHALTAVYNGDSAYATSTSSALSLTVNSFADTVTLAIGANPAYQYQNVPMTASVAGFDPSGTVTFLEGSTTLGSAPVSAGKATFTAQFSTAGTRTLTASYSGDGNDTPATSLGVSLQILPGGPIPVSPAPIVNYEYDAQGNPTKAIQGPGVSGFNFATQSSYDKLNRAKDSTDARSGVTLFGYDGLDRTVQVTDPRSLVTQIPRNGLGDATSLVSPDTGTATHTYDVAGNLSTRTDARGVLATHGYDALNRLTSTVYSKSGETSLSYTWTYDQTGAGFSNGIGRLTSTTHPAGSTQYSYDAQGRLLTDTQGVSPASGANSAAVTTTVTYTYDTTGHVTSILYPSGRKLALTYTDGEVSAMALAKDAASTPANLISQIKWEAFGGVRSWQWQLASSTQLHDRLYDAYGRVIRYRMGGSLRDLSYDAANRITGYTHYDGATAVTQPSLDQGFAYDELGRLTGITASTASWSIGYDANGNRTGVTLNGTASTYTTAATSNRISSITNPARSFGYDAAGNTTADTYTATYDLAGRMATLAKAGTTTTYSVDGMGRRVRKFASTGATSTIIFVYDQNGQLLGEYSNTGATLREYVWLGATPVAVFTPDTVAANPPLVYYIHTDHLGTPRLVIDKNNQQRWSWIADPFGTAAANDNPQSLGAFTFNLRFPGQYADSESGLFYNYFRDYDASTGRYAQSDPIGLDGGINTYSYVGSNPLSQTDPDGRLAFLAALPAIVGGTGWGWGSAAVGASAILATAAIPGSTSTTQVCTVPDDPCQQFRRDLEQFLALMDTKYVELLEDKQKLFTLAYGPAPVAGLIGTWTGHVDRYNSLLIGLLRLIQRGKSMGCWIPPKAFIYLTRPTPDAPRTP